MAPIPRDRTPDSTFALLTQGYAFIPTRCRRYGSDVFETRLMLRRAICMQGAEAARAFYQPGRFTRKRAMPKTALMLLLDKGSVQLLDDEAHRWRKQMFMSLMDAALLRELADIAEQEWRAAAARWSTRDEVVMHDEVQELLCRAVCRWAGLALDEQQIERRTGEFAAMIEGAGAIGPRNWRGAMLRARAERFWRGIVARIRDGALTVPDGRAAHTISWHRDLRGELLDEKVAAVELINVLRPTVAVARFVTFAALALHENPRQRQRLAAGNEEYLEAFVQEVRRYYPFFPFIGGRARQPFDWRGHHFATGTWVILDLYGTNHDARTWEAPEQFRPDRFLGRSVNAFELIPQGGGEFLDNHRCAGEWLTISLMKQAVRFLTEAIAYDVPPQKLTIDLGRMPAIPHSHLRIRAVRAPPAAGRLDREERRG